LVIAVERQDLVVSIGDTADITLDLRPFGEDASLDVRDARRSCGSAHRRRFRTASHGRSPARSPASSGRHRVRASD
jgi:hypothetical protein